MKHPKNEITKTQNGDTKLKAPEKTVTQNLRHSPSTQKLTQDDAEFISNDLNRKSFCSKNLQNNINVQNSNNHTALDFAVSEGKLKSVKILLEHGAVIHHNGRLQCSILYDAVNNCSTPEVLEILLKYTTVNTPDLYKRTALHWAVILQNEKAVQMLVQYGANPNICNSDGKTPLDIAVAQNNPKIVQLLQNHSKKSVGDADAALSLTNTQIESKIPENKELSQQKITIIPEADKAKADPNILDNDNKFTAQTPVNLSPQFYSMCKQQTLTHKEMRDFEMRIFSSLNFIEENQPDVDGNTPLHLAIKAGNQFATKKLISVNAKVDIQDKDGKTALHYLAQKGKVYEMQKLIEKGTDLKNIQDKDGKTVLDDMASYSPEMKNLLNSADKIYANAQIHTVAEKGTLEEMKNLIAKGADINHRGPNDRTVLHVAVQNGNQEMVKLLIENNADIEATNNHGRTALYVAVENGNHSMVEFLFNKGAKLDIQDACQKPPLHVAASRDNKEVIIFLIKNGANVNQQDKYEQTSLHYAAQNRNPVIAECLIKNGANVNQQDKYGNTPLYYAIHKTLNKQTVQCLINAGADLSITHNNGETYLQIAQTKGNQESSSTIAKS